MPGSRPSACPPVCPAGGALPGSSLAALRPPARVEAAGCSSERAQEGGEGKAEEQTGGGEECARGREVGESECVSISGSGGGWYLRQSSRGGWVGGRGGR